MKSSYGAVLTDFCYCLGPFGPKVGPFSIGAVFDWGRFRLGLFLTGAVFEWAVFFFFLYSTDTFRCILVLVHRGARNVYIHVQMWFKSSMYSAGKKQTLKAPGSLTGNLSMHPRMP